MEEIFRILLKKIKIHSKEFGIFHFDTIKTVKNKNTLSGFVLITTDLNVLGINVSY